ncbi:protein of unknown function [Methylocaldum szegediense]|uniref:Uncharacterized protein n=1 Tax=Methylocaldum szegediense TaxID=73780 RepID=A0ABM9I832_9GAMM|nr:protein of unknown function [Methylocaldum szegediense]
MIRIFDPTAMNRTKRGAVKTDLFADQPHKQTLDKLGGPLWPKTSTASPRARSAPKAAGRRCPPKPWCASWR